MQSLHAKHAEGRSGGGREVLSSIHYQLRRSCDNLENGCTLRNKWNQVEYMYIEFDTFHLNQFYPVWRTVVEDKTHTHIHYV